MHVEWESGGRITADGRPIAQVDRSFWGERAEVDIEGEHWVFGKVFGGLVAELDGQERMRADKSGFFSSTHEVRTSGGHTITLEKSGFFGRGYRIVAPHGVVAEVESASMWMTRPSADFPDDTPAADAVFVLWAVYILMQRQQAAASSSGS